ncbi:hypothetical protein AMEX_G12668 [Astyanax mexicanus]|uniref:ISXO2-like transposase domain-containing protein n=1 Tax=Astyanax mexicanus TaxID=7994 RepID=A0A8T2LRR4_ASTMX|nr:hypothetical protein AMEX_G12668 [Astyanax mexicanus]
MKCRLCQQYMQIKTRLDLHDGLQWECRYKTHRGKNVKKSVRSGSIFERSKIRLQSWMQFIYRFAQGLKLRQIHLIQDGVSRSTRQHLGGHREFVVIDESNFCHKRKYGRGRFGRTWNRRKWVFGLLGVREQRRRPILRLVEKRSRRHLLPIIRKHVRRGSTIISDQWRAYMGALHNAGYTHFSVNHKRWFVDPQSGGHTQHLERAWGIYKGQIWRLRGNRTEKLLKEHLSVIEWTYWLGKNHREGPLGRLLKAIRQYFPV